MCARSVPLLRTCPASFQPPRSWRWWQIFKCSVAEQLDMGSVILKDRVFRIPLARLSRFVRTRAALTHSTQYFRLFQHV